MTLRSRPLPRPPPRCLATPQTSHEPCAHELTLSQQSDVAKVSSFLLAGDVTMEKKLSEEELQDLYAWIDNIPLSRPKRNISRDFSDGGRSLEFSLKAKLAFKLKDDLLSTNRVVKVNSSLIKNTFWHHLAIRANLFICLFISASLLLFVVMAAEVVKHFFPKLVEMHNYVPANSTQQKLSNWSVLNRQGQAPRCVCSHWGRMS